MIVQSCITDLPPPRPPPPPLTLFPWFTPDYPRATSNWIPRARVVTRRFDQSAFDNF